MSACAQGPCGAGGVCVEEPDGGGFRCVCVKGLVPPLCTPAPPDPPAVPASPHAPTCADITCPPKSHCEYHSFWLPEIYFCTVI